MLHCKFIVNENETDFEPFKPFILCYVKGIVYGEKGETEFKVDRSCLTSTEF